MRSLDYIAHYGIKGMKWGVRRYENKDGTLTPEGRRRYRSSFRVTEDDVRTNASNNYSSFIEELRDLDVIQRRGNLSTREAKQCRRLADKIFKNARHVEPKITRDVVGIVKDTSATMYGLKHRLKQPSSLAAKIGSDAKEKDISFTDAAGSINDAIRYTAISDNKDFTRNYRSIKTNLESAGYREVKCKNYFDLYAKGRVMHKAVQSTFEDNRGNRFEFQFQTPASQAAKELKIPIYEERRKLGVTQKRAAELENQMRDLADKVKDPKGVMSIRSH